MARHIEHGGLTAARAGAADTLSEQPAAPLGFLHLDGGPVILACCELQSIKLRAGNTERTNALKAIEQQGPAADLLAYTDLVTAARLGVLRLRVWSSLEVLAREGVSCYAD